MRTAKPTPRPLRSLALSGLLVLAAAAPRFYGLGSKSLWLDEAATMNAIDDSLGSVVNAVMACDAHPPLYYGLLHVWMHRPAATVRGVVPAEEKWLFLCRSHSALQARAFSAVVGVATVLVFYWLARVLIQPRFALLSALVLALSAFHVYFAQEVRMYALAAFLVTLSWFFMVELVAGRRLERWPLWLGLALSNAAAIYTFYYCAFSVAAQGLVLLLLWRSIGRKLLLPWLCWELLPAALFALYVPVILDRLASLRGKLPPGGGGILTIAALRWTGAQFACGFLPRLAGAAGPVLEAAAALVAAGVVGLGLVAGRRLRCAEVVAGVWLFAPLVMLAVLPVKGHIYEPKHLLFASPALALFLGAALSAGGRRVRGAGMVALGLLLALNLASLVAYLRPGVEKEDWRDAIGELARRVEPGDYVVLNPPWVQQPFLYYYGRVYRGPRVLTKLAPLAGRPFPTGQLNEGRRVWVVEAASHIAMPNPAVLRALAPYGPPLFQKRYPGLVGTVTVALFETFRPMGRPASDAPRGP